MLHETGRFAVQDGPFRKSMALRPNRRQGNMGLYARRNRRGKAIGRALAGGNAAGSPHRHDHAGIAGERRRAVVGHGANKMDGVAGLCVGRHHYAHLGPVAATYFLAAVCAGLGIMPPTERQTVAVGVGRGRCVERQGLARPGTRCRQACRPGSPRGGGWPRRNPSRTSLPELQNRSAHP